MKLSDIKVGARVRCIFSNSIFYRKIGTITEHFYNNGYVPYVVTFGNGKVGNFSMLSSCELLPSDDNLVCKKVK